MTLLDLIHEQYETADGRPVVFRCTECGQRSQSLGSLHAHIESHRGYTRFNIQIPFTHTSLGEFDELMERTEVLAVEDISTVDLRDVEGF